MEQRQSQTQRSSLKEVGEMAEQWEGEALGTALPTSWHRGSAGLRGLSDLGFSISQEDQVVGAPWQGFTHAGQCPGAAEDSQKPDSGC